MLHAAIGLTAGTVYWIVGPCTTFEDAVPRTAMLCHATGDRSRDGYESPTLKM